FPPLLVPVALLRMRALRGPVAIGAGSTNVIAALRNNLETKRARERNRLDEFHLHLVAEAIGLAGAIANQRVVLLLVTEELGANGARRHEAVGAGLVELHEQPGAGDAGHMAAERSADPIDQMIG